MLVLLSKAIKLIVVYTKAQPTIRLSHKEHGRGKGGAARHNKALIQVVKQVFFDRKELLSSHLVERAIAQIILLCELDLVVYGYPVRGELVQGLLIKNVFELSILRKPSEAIIY